MAPGRPPGSPSARVIGEFTAEAEELLEQLRAGLADVADADARGEAPAPEQVNQLFRAAHTLKGLASSVGLDAGAGLAHALEDVLDRMRLGRLAGPSAALPHLDEAVGLLAQLVAGAGRGAPEAATARAAAEAAARLRTLGHAPDAVAREMPEIPLDPAVLGALTEYEEHRLAASMAAGRAIHWMEANLPLESFEEGLGELTRAASERGEVIATLPAPGDAPETEIRFGLLVASDLAEDAFRARLGSPSVTVTAVWPPAAAAPASASPEPRPAGPPAEPPPSRPQRAGASAVPGPAPAGARPVPGGPSARARAAATELASLRSIGGTVRVDIRKLDELMNLVGELVIVRGALDGVARRAAAQPATARLGAELEQVDERLRGKLRELQEAVLEARMVPLAQVFEKLSRVVRRLHRDLGKEVRLEIRGAETELDKLIVEELVDPLMHVVRNSFDHAIEPPDEREAAGKPRHGVIRLEAFQRGSHVVIQVRDDGRGIDEEAVRRRAVALGLLAPDAVPSRAQLVDAMLTAGFSTREQVTETSGRGVGLDVVRSNVTALGGLLDVDWTPGQGTCTTFTLPITLAIVQALMVKAGGQRFAIPLASVHETLLVAPGDLQRSESGELLDLRGAPLPVRRLDQEFGLPEQAPAGDRYVVVVGLADLRFGLLVDALEGRRDAVIKPIQGPVASVRGIAGATEVGGEGPVLVLDVSALAEDALGSREAA